MRDLLRLYLLVVYVFNVFMAWQADRLASSRQGHVPRIMELIPQATEN